MKKIVVISQFISTQYEEGNDRFRYIIENLIDKNQNSVELITSRFFHTEKKHRNIEQDFSNLDYKMTFIDEPGYQKNVSLKRIYSHHILAKNIKRYLEKMEKPDIIYLAIPSLDVAKVVARYTEKNNIRLIIDVQDLWPEAFKMVFNIPILCDLIFYPMKKQADYAYSKADDIVAVSDTYMERAAQVNTKYEEKISVYLGTDLQNFDKAKKENEILKFDKVVRIAYIGTLGHSYDLKNVIDAISILKERQIKNLLFVVMGNGPLKEEFESYAKEKQISCEFTGMLNYEEMVGKLCSCDIAVNPITKGAAQSIINKVGDYAAAGLPVINTQENIEYKSLVEDYQIGFNVIPNDAHDMADKIEILYKDEALRKMLGSNNRKLAEQKFDRNKTYLKIKELLEK